MRGLPIVLLALAACSTPSSGPMLHPPPPSTPPSPAAPTEVPQPGSGSWPSADEVPTLTRDFYQTLGVIHATYGDPNAPDTPFLDSLQPCQIEPARALEHPGLTRFFPKLRFFVSVCDDGSYAVVSIDDSQSVRLVSLEPHARLPATAWDEVTGGPVVIATADDAKLFAAAFGAMYYLETVSMTDLVITEERGTGNFAGTHYYKVRSPSFVVTLASGDGRAYNIASNQRL